MRIYFALLAMSIGLGACAVRSDLPQPVVDKPMSWQTTREGAGVWPDAAWWRGFGSAELDRLMDEAAVGNLDLRAALFRIGQAQANARVAGAALYPQVSADAGATRETRTAGPIPSSTVFLAGPAISYEVDLFGRIRSASDASVQRLVASAFDREALALSIHSNVAITYFQLVALRERVALATRSLANARELLTRLEELRSAETVTELELAQQRVRVDQLIALLPALRQLEREALSTLALLLGRLPQDLHIEGRRLSTLQTPAVTAGLPSELLLRRPDIRRAEAALCAANLDVTSARAARFPRIQLSAAGGIVSAALGGVFGPAGLLVTLATSLTAPLLDGGRLKGQEQLGRARYAELMETYRAATLAAFSETENALSGSARYREQLAAMRSAYNNANDAYRLADEQFRGGTVDFLTVLDAQRDVIAINDTVVQAQLSQFTALVQLYKALGGGWDGSIYHKDVRSPCASERQESGPAGPTEPSWQTVPRRQAVPVRQTGPSWNTGPTQRTEPSWNTGPAPRPAWQRWRPLPSWQTDLNRRSPQVMP